MANGSRPRGASASWPRSSRLGSSALPRASRSPRLRPLATAVAALVLLGGCDLSLSASQLVAQPGPAPGGAMTEALVGTVGPLNPLFEQEENAADIDSLVYQGLTRVEDDTSNGVVVDSERVVGLLAKDWSVSPDGLTYTVNLRSGIRWADGQPFTVADVLFTFSVLQSPDYNQPTNQIWKGVKVEQAGPNSVRFTLKAPSASFPLALRQAIIPKHVFQDVPIASIPSDPHSGAEAFGTGPYKVAAISADHHQVTLVRSSTYSPAPFLDRVTFQTYPSLQDALDAVLQGQATAVGAPELPNVTELAKRPDLDVYQPSTFSVVTVLFNLTQNASTFFDQRTRRALVMAIDRRAIVDKVLGPDRAELAFGPIPPTDWAYSRAETEDRLTTNPAAAARLLDQDGWTLRSPGGVRTRSGQPFSVSLVTEDSFPYRQVADAVSAQLRKIGVEVKVQPVSASALVSNYLIPKQYQMALFAYDSGPDPDQYLFWRSDAPSGTLNFMGPLVARPDLIDKDLLDGRAGANRTQRKRAYDDFQALMTQAAPAIFLFEPHYTYLVSRRSQRLLGVQMNKTIEPVDRLEYVARWYRNTQA
jgi:peptide/nickel transport system substrate-binding protein